ncbi:DUF1272 domain-containing protein [Burkholderia plantarii]|uniref:DUF1272 domain-containing protein n=1 Tax=Burkholderia plantarii TaxID=41899 RepID=UPI000B2107D3
MAGIFPFLSGTGIVADRGENYDGTKSFIDADVTCPEPPMLELRPICEHCAKPLPPEAPDARICSYECTFCAACVEQVLLGVCPNCGGGFAPRPIRPASRLTRHPPATEAIHHPVDPVAHSAFAARSAAGTAE